MTCSKLMDGRYVVQEIGHSMDKYENMYDGITGAFIQVGDNSASTLYVNNKLKLCEAWGIYGNHYKYPDNITEAELIEVISCLNKDKDIHGIMVQLPLPEHINEQKIINAIDPMKDIDGFTDVNKGRLMIGDSSAIEPCTPKGIMTMLETFHIDPNGKTITIVGRSNIVGKPLAQMLINKGATVIVANSKTPHYKLADMIAMSDIFISAIGQPNYWNYKWFKENGLPITLKYGESICDVAIDVGINRDENGKLCGDISRDIYDNFRLITPVPNGVGRTTVMEVVRNIIKCYEVQKKNGDGKSKR